MVEPTMQSRRFVPSAFWVMILGFLCTLIAWQWSHAQTGDIKGAGKTSDLIRFEVKAVPADPFDPANQQKSSADLIKVRRNQVVKIVLTGTPKAGYHTYPLTKRTASQEPV